MDIIPYERGYCPIREIRAPGLPFLKGSNGSEGSKRKLAGFSAPKVVACWRRQAAQKGFEKRFLRLTGPLGRRVLKFDRPAA
jgi:hypothetical protein